MWPAIGAIGILLVFVLGLLVYIRRSPDDSQLQQAKADQIDKARAAAEEQIKAKAAQVKKELEANVKEVLAIQDVDARRRAALELLKRVRAVD